MFHDIPDKDELMLPPSNFAFVHALVKDKFINDDILEGICGHKGEGHYVGVVESVTCPKCLALMKGNK